jgi:hypothetical protein
MRSFLIALLTALPAVAAVQSMAKADDSIFRLDRDSPFTEALDASEREIRAEWPAPLMLPHFMTYARSATKSWTRLEMPSNKLLSDTGATVLSGGPDFIAPFEISKGLVSAGSIPGKYDDDTGAFRFVCGGEGPIRYDDPIVYPGQPGRSHLHYFFGQHNADAFMTGASMATSASTTCNNTKYSFNRSSYWIPALVNDQGEVIRANAIVVYYKRSRSTSGFCTPGNPRFQGICVGIPNDLQFVTGWNMYAPKAKVVGASWYCTTGDGLHHDNLDSVFSGGCSAGSTLVADTLGQNCWDGKNTDSPDHRSHLAFMFYDGSRADPVCPKGYPYVIPQQENKVMWLVTTDMIGTRANGSKYSRIRLASDAMLPGAKSGQTLHADYKEKWDARVKKLWLDNCIDKGLSCNSGELGNGQMLIGAMQPAYGWTNPSPREPVPAHP